MNAIRRLSSVFFAVLLAASAAADELGRVRIRQMEIDGVTWNYSIRGNHAMLGGPGVSAVAQDTAGRVCIPSEIDGFQVLGYTIPLFRNCENLEEVDFSNLRSSHLEGTFFRNCPSLRRVVFQRRPYFVGGSSDGDPFFRDCPNVREIVFPGSVPTEFRGLGISLDGKLRVGREFERAWQVFAEDHDVTGMQILDDPLARDSASSPTAGVPGPAPRPGPDLSIALAYAARDPACKPLETLAAQMIAAIGKKKEEMEEKEKTLRTSMRGALEHAKAAAQAKGDLDGVLLFDEAAKNPDATTRSDNETLRNIYKTRDEAKAGYRVAFDQDCARVLAAAVTQLGKMKAEETKKGNIALAKEVDAYEKTVQGALDRLQNSLKRAGVSAGTAAAGKNPAADGKTGDASVAGPASPGGTSRNITVQVDRANGAALGRFEQGEILIVQYLSGTYRPYRGSNRSVNPDVARDFYYSSEGTPVVEGPLNNAARRTYSLPKGTSKRPFAIVVSDAGHFSLKCYAGNYSEGRLSYKVTKLSVLEAKEFEKSGKKSDYQWP